MWLTDDAVVGVWPAGESIEVIVERAGRRTVSLRGLALQRVNHHFVDTNFQPSGIMNKAQIGRKLETLRCFAFCRWGLLLLGQWIAR